MNLIDFGKRVRQRRVSLGMSQAELADKVTMAGGTVSRIESGKGGEPTYDAVRKLAWALETSPAWLIDGDSLDFRLALSRFEADPPIKEALLKMAGYFETAASWDRDTFRSNLVKVGNITARSGLNMKPWREGDLADARNNDAPLNSQ